MRVSPIYRIPVPAREGQEVEEARTGIMTRSSVDGTDKIATMDINIRE